MKCVECGSEKGTTLIDEVYQYTESGLPEVTIEGVSVWTCSGCGGSVARLPNITTIHRTIAQAILKQKSWSRAEAEFLKSVAEMGESDIESTPMRVQLIPAQLLDS